MDTQDPLKVSITHRFAEALRDHLDLSTPFTKPSSVHFSFGRPTVIQLRVADWGRWYTYAQDTFGVAPSRTAPPIGGTDTLTVDETLVVEAYVSAHKRH